MIKEIIQNIKITALTDKATAKLNQMKSTMNSIPKLLLLKTLNYDKAIDSMKTSMLSLAAIATAATAVIRKGFLGLAELLQSIKRLNTAILITGTQANISASSLMNYFLTLLSGIGLSADELATIASKFVSAGIASLSMVRQYTNATIGLALQTGKSVDEVSDKLIRALQGQTKGLKLFGIATNTGATSQLLLNEALRRGSIAFNNIDTNSATRSMMIFRLSFNNMLLGFAVKFLPAISSIINFIAKNLNVIGNILLGAAIFGAMKQILKIGQAVYALTLGNAAALARLIKLKMSIINVDVARLQTLIQQGIATKQQQIALQRQLATIEIYNARLATTGTLANSLKNIFSASNIVLLAATVALTLILNNWTKIKLKITGVTELTRRHNDAIADATSEYVNYKAKLDASISSLLTLLSKLELTNSEINTKKGLIDLLNTNYGSLLSSNIDYNDSLLTMRGKLVNVNSKLLDHKKLLIDTAIIKANELNISSIILKKLKAEEKIQNILKSKGIKTVELYKKKREELFYILLKVDKAIKDRDNALTELNNVLAEQIKLQKEINSLFDYSKTAKTTTVVKPPDIVTSTAVTAPKETEYSYTNLQRLQDEIDLTISKINLLPEEANTALQRFSLYDALTSQYRQVLQEYSTLISSLNKEDVNYTENFLKYNALMLNARKDAIDTMKRYTIPVVDPMEGQSALLNIQLSPILLWMSLFTTKAWLTSTMLLMAFVDTFNSISVAWDSLASNIGNGFAAVLVQGQSWSRAMTYVFRDFAKSVIALISKIILKLLLAFALKNILSIGSGSTLGNAGMGDLPPIIGYTSVNPNTNDNAYTKDNAFRRIQSSASSNIISISTSNLLYSGKNKLINKLDEVITAVSNIQPVQTQIIDLPTLATANRIGNSMILQGI